MSLLIDDVTFRYRRRRPPVLDRFTHRTTDGLTILLGPNGAGKSTLLSLLAGISRPNSGRIALGGVESTVRAYRSEVAWLPQHVPASKTLTAREYVAYIAWLKGVDRSTAWENAARVLGRVNLAAEAGKRTAHLSGGQLRRVGIACALAHNAKLILLDEPTAGLDPHQRSVFRALVREVAAETPVLMSTHDVADLAEEADTVTCLLAGRVTYDGPTAGFLTHAATEAAPGRQAESAYTTLMGLV
ncbi:MULTISPECIES: ATP-binding cassette domain-containing protein [Streptomyces]|uniref:ATP-binding cassette domain-containing protein n=1 Tax=Streptomyces chiangmaiensis TaxID=766497 RepID=A0ABU7FT06_9ACTN|nr:ATP-binding cassette domain-containing protein [Streptomyces chiangmaiensis]MED7826942.1 ATP-binding cassette domain-containing protein [Streptomyces chiangmaiensis]